MAGEDAAVTIGGGKVDLVDGQVFGKSLKGENNENDFPVCNMRCPVLGRERQTKVLIDAQQQHRQYQWQSDDTRP